MAGMNDPDEVMAKLREASRYTVKASEFLQTARDNEALRAKMIAAADEQLKFAIDVIAELGKPSAH